MLFRRFMFVAVCALAIGMGANAVLAKSPVAVDHEPGVSVGSEGSSEGFAGSGEIPPHQGVDMPAPPMPDADACHASQYKHLIGKTEAQLADVIFKAKRVRVICDKCAVTEDFSPTRLNVQLDAAGKVKALTCG